MKKLSFFHTPIILKVVYKKAIQHKNTYTKTLLLFDTYILPNIGGIIYFFKDFQLPSTKKSTIDNTILIVLSIS